MSNNDFFNESKEQSKIKSAIVSKYFDAWARVMIGAQDRQAQSRRKMLFYIDLFAGPGRYKDGTVSTPLLILQKAIENPKLRERLYALFNDVDDENVRSLETAISQLPGVETLAFKPKIWQKKLVLKSSKRLRKSNWNQH